MVRVCMDCMVEVPSVNYVLTAAFIPNPGGLTLDIFIPLDLGYIFISLW